MNTHHSEDVKRTLAAVERVSDVIGPLPDGARGNVIFVAYAATNGNLVLLPTPEMYEMAMVQFIDKDALVFVVIASLMIADLQRRGCPETARTLEAKRKEADRVPVMAIISSAHRFVLAELRYCHVSAGGSA